jgi:Phosphotransferase enzyme family
MIPCTADDLTVEWCSEALGRQVDTVETAPLGVGVGLVGQLYRLQCTTPEGPISIIAKMAAVSEENRFVAMVLNMHGREVGFYSELAEQAQISVPECHYSAHNPENHDCVLLLEDLAPRGELKDQIAGAGLEEVAPAIRVLARFHASTWDDPTKTSAPWLPRLDDPNIIGAVQMAYASAWPKIQEFFPELLTPALQKLGDEYSDHIPALFGKLCEGPRVLSHGDWRLDNLVFTPDGDVVAFDWQLCDSSVGPRDLSYLVTQSLELDSPEQYTEALDIYLEELAAAGIDVDRAWAEEMYRYGTLLGFVYPVVAGGALTIDDPRHVELCRTLLVRSITALEALDAFDLPL